MGQRLQVQLPDDEMAEIRRLARSEQITVGEWVRRVLREACSRKSARDVERKLRAIREAATCSFPTADIEQMLDEIERGYLE